VIIWLHQVTNRDIRNGSDGYLITDAWNTRYIVSGGERGGDSSAKQRCAGSSPARQVSIQPTHIPLISGSIHREVGASVFL